MNTKTAISVPPEIFKLSQRLAKKLKVSRSAVFAMGVKKLGKEMEEDEADLIAQINAVCAEIDTSLDPFWKELQSRTLPKDKW
jgi:hypothetical protein